MDYLDFNLKIGPRTAENRYHVSAQSAVSGEASGILTLAESYKLGSSRWNEAQELGGKIFDALFTNGIYASYFASHLHVTQQGRGLRIKLTLDVPELLNYPWELLFDPKRGQFLCLFEETPIIRYVKLPRPIPPLTVSVPLRMLVVAPCPKDYEQLDIVREQQNLSRALDNALKIDLIKIDWLPHATFDILRQQLGERAYHIFHFIGHGEFDSNEADGLLVFEDETRHSIRVSARKLATILGNHTTLRLATLNACEGARTSEQDLFAGTAMTLLRTGNLPAVVAMRSKISDSAAIDFAEMFYSGIITTGRVEPALTQARLAVFSQNINNVEWGTPVLYLRAQDGILFQMAEERPALGHMKQDRVAEISNERELPPRDLAKGYPIDKVYYQGGALSGKTETEPENLPNFYENQINPILEQKAPSCITDFVQPALQLDHLIIVGAEGNGKTFLNRQIEFWARSISRQWIVVNWKEFIPLFEEGRKSVSSTLESLMQDLYATLVNDERFVDSVRLINWNQSSSWREQLAILKKVLLDRHINGVFISIDNLDKYSELRPDKPFLEFLVTSFLRKEIMEDVPPCYLRLFMEPATFQGLDTKQWPWNKFKVINLNWNNLQKQKILQLRAKTIQGLETQPISETELKGMVYNANTLREAILQLKKYYEREILNHSMVFAEWETES